MGNCLPGSGSPPSRLNERRLRFFNVNDCFHCIKCPQFRNIDIDRIDRTFRLLASVKSIVKKAKMRPKSPDQEFTSTNLKSRRCGCTVRSSTASTHPYFSTSSPQSNPKGPETWTRTKGTRLAPKVESCRKKTGHLCTLVRPDTIAS